MCDLAKVVEFTIGCFWDFLINVSLLLHSSDDITHSSLLRILQYTPPIKSEEEQKWHKTETVISQKW